MPFMVDSLEWGLPVSFMVGLSNHTDLFAGALKRQPTAKLDNLCMVADLGFVDPKTGVFGIELAPLGQKGDQLARGHVLV